LQVDHINNKEKISHRIWSWSEKRRNEELAKCQALCLICHKEKTRSEFLTGENHPQSKLRNEDVKNIKENLLGTISQVEIAKMYGVDPKTITRIKTGDIWKHI
jgi:uncharacterized protein YnzC (UPF0291/DUF896 family)